MFAKPYTVKSSTKLKSSDRTKLHERVARTILCEGEEERVWPVKTDIAVMKVQLAGGRQCNIYVDATNGNRPLVFEDKHDQLYLLNSIDVPTKTSKVLVPENVMAFIERGADLMLPGVIQPDERFYTRKIAKLEICGLYLLSADCHLLGPVALIQALKSGQEMYESAMKGKGFNVLHVVNDHLWSTSPVPLKRVPFVKSVTIDRAVEGLSITGAVDPSSSHPDDQAQVDPDDEDEEEDPNTLLERCFLAAVKHRLPKDDFPYDVGQFYVCCVLKCVPTGQKLDMKKTKWKKFGVFLKERISNRDHPILRIVEKAAGVDSIVGADFKHAELKAFKLTDEPIVDAEESSTSFNAPHVEEIFLLTSNALPIFHASDKSLKRQDVVGRPHARQCVERYIEINDLKRDGGNVELDDNLRRFLQLTSFTSTMQIVRSKVAAPGLTAAWRLTWPQSDGAGLRRLPLILKTPPTISLTVENRMGKKKVTLVRNLASFAIDAAPFCTLIATKAASSATVQADDSVLVQGNSVKAVGDLLTSVYKIDPKYIKGLEFAPKDKKGKKKVMM